MTDDRGKAPKLEDVFEGVTRLVQETRHGTLRILYVEFLPGGAAPAPDHALAHAEGMGSTEFELQYSIRGHATIAYMAEEVLNRENKPAFQRLQALIASDPKARGDVADLAMWPDNIKHPPRGAVLPPDEVALAKASRPWHYVDILYRPGQSDPPQIPQGETVLAALPTQLALLKSADALEAVNALAFVIHFVGDIHQPLHCATLADDRYFEPPEWDRGGNGIAWGTSQSRPPTLHSLWDGTVANKPAEVMTRVEELLNEYPRTAFQHETSMDLTDWALASHALARKAYDRFLDEAEYDEDTERFSSPSSAYRKWARQVGRERAALAAYRLADLLDKFMP